ncbi:MAG: alkaline phosphatase family protein [Thermoplasmata archaeon]
MRSRAGDRVSPKDEVRSLLKERRPLDLPVPAYGGRSVPNITRSVVEAIGATPEGDPPMLPPLAPDLDPFHGGAAEGPVVVLLVDALGWGAFGSGEGRSLHRPPASWRERARPITTVFPTTTTAALTSLSTGTSPGCHGLGGYRQYLPRFGVVADLIRMTPLGVTVPESLVGPRWSPSLVSGAPSIFRRGVRGVALSRDKFAGTGFTRLLYDGAEYVPYASASDMAHLLAELLNRARPPPVIFVYWDELDTVQHRRGPLPELIHFEIGQLARLIGFVRDRVGARRRKSTTLLVTGDHGQVPATLAARIQIEQDPKVMELLSHPPAGDRRSGFFSATPGRLPALRKVLNDRLPPGSRVIAMPTALRAGLFGPPPFHPEIRDRLGDLLVLVPSPAGLTYLPPGSVPSPRYSLGAHGGLEPDELLVPLIAGRLGEMGLPDAGTH